MIPAAKRETYEFAKELLEDVDRMAEAFGKERSPNDLLLQSWQDLKAMRQGLYGLACVLWSLFF
jgi:hypothetical protein